MNNKSLDLISESFFASRIIDIAKKTKLESEDIKLLKEALKQIDEIKKGQKIVAFEKPDGYSISSITAYRRAINIIPHLEEELGIVDDQPEHCISNFLQEIEKEIRETIAAEVVENNSLFKTRLFFKEIRKITLQEGNNAFIDRRQDLPWLEPAIY
jgi:hypothetical protein